jgi:uncharacterized protein (TIGR00369 family)
MTSAVDQATAHRIRDSFAKQGLMTHLGAQIESVAPGRVVIVLPYRAEVTQQNGYIHAGATSAIADSAGGYATLTLCPPDSDVLTVEYKINLVAPAIGERLEAVGEVVKAGRTLTVTTLDVHAVRDGSRTLVATGQQTVMCLRPRADGTD